MKTTRLLQAVFLILCFVFILNSSAQAQVAVVRGGDENPVVTIGKSTLYGAGTGILLGLALSLVVEEDFEDIMKWSFVGGTIGGFVIGLVHVATRSQPRSAMLQFDHGRLAKITLPEPQIVLNSSRALEARFSLLQLSF